MYKLGQYLLADNRRAAIIAVLCLLLPLVGGFLAAVIVGLVTLNKGSRAGLLLLAFVALPVVSLLVLRRFGMESALFGFLFLRCALIWGMASILRRTRSWALTVEWFVLLGALVIVGIHLGIPQIKSLWVQWLTHYVKEYDWMTISRWSSVGVSSLQAWAPFLTGLATFGLLLGTLVQLVLARWWQTLLFSPGLVRQEMTQIRVNGILSIILVIASVGLYWQPGWLMDVYPVLILPFMLAGLSLLHRLAAVKKECGFLVVGAYVALVLLAVIAVGVLSIVGWIDSWYNFRKRHALLQR
ncbi:MAG: hypothetical protein A3F41_03860 [Coxiella sp. RIFCSPHIGHO2_12_FULL_44_14]|nr:MAG: hypothetical protein A3F41_03860 [Coxiella sp. RIFCSPHIGHO2_12_FULL_44_14]